MIKKRNTILIYVLVADFERYLVSFFLMKNLTFMIFKIDYF